MNISKLINGKEFWIVRHAAFWFVLYFDEFISPTKIITILKSITAKQIFKRHPEVKKFLWGGKFWSSGYYVNTVGQYGNLKMIRRYVESQGQSYKQIYRTQLKLF